MIMKMNYQELPPVLTNRIGPLLLIVGFISILQASGVFPVGASNYPEAAILLSLGGLLSLGSLASTSHLARFGQGVLAVAAICLVVIF